VLREGGGRRRRPRMKSADPRNDLAMAPHTVRTNANPPLRTALKSIRKIFSKNAPHRNSSVLGDGRERIHLGERDCFACRAATRKFWEGSPLAHAIPPRAEIED